jgi:PAS domain S-box-containing protein
MRAQSQANQQRENLQVTLASIGDAVIVVDVLGKVTFLNHAAELVTRWSFADAISQPLTRVFNIINESTRDTVESPAARALREGTVVGLANHTVLIAKDGHEVSIDDSAAPIRDEAGVVSGVVLVFRDISIKRRLEMLEKEQHAAMITTQRRKDEFLAMLAHELRNPIAPIANALQLMAIRTPSPAELTELREIMTRQIDQMRRLIDDLLDISRISRGKFDLQSETIELGTVLRSAIDTSRPLIDAAGHTLSTQIPAGAIYFPGDPIRLAQVVANLLNNAAKYTERGGRILLSAEVCQQEVVIRIKDSGVGISPEQLEHVFEVFTQVDTSLTRSQGGLGIGLTLAKNIVEMHGGSIEAHSNGSGQGSEFIVRLPIRSDSAAPRPALAPGEALNRLPKRKILIVDDMRASAMVLSRLLAALGQDVRTAHDGAAALEAVGSEKFDLIFSDIAMPGMSGYELAPKLSAHPNAKNAMLIALTGYGQHEDVDRASRAGFEAHLVKPVSLDSLREILERSSNGAAKG